MRRRLPLVLCIVFALLATACGGGDDGPDDAADDGTDTSDTTAPDDAGADDDTDDGATTTTEAPLVPPTTRGPAPTLDVEPVTSIANVLGRNVFDLLVAIPAGVLIAGAATINYSVAAPMMGVLTFATIFLFVVLRTRMELSRGESIMLLVLYAAFVIWLGCESFNLIDLVPGLPPHPGSVLRRRRSVRDWWSLRSQPGRRRCRRRWCSVTRSRSTHSRQGRG